MIEEVPPLLMAGLFIFVISILFIICPGLFTLKKQRKEIEKLTTPRSEYHPIMDLPDIEAEAFEHRVATLEAWRKNHNGDWTPQGVPEWYMDCIEPSLNLDTKLCGIGLDSVSDQIRAYYEKLREIKYAGICPSGYRYLAAEFYCASSAIADLVDQIYRLNKLKDLAGDELLPNERLDPVLSELRSGINLIIERHFEGELIELVKMAINEQLGTSEILKSKLPPESSCHITTAEEIARLKFLADKILAGPHDGQLISIADIY